MLKTYKQFIAENETEKVVFKVMFPNSEDETMMSDTEVVTELIDYLEGVIEKIEKNDNDEPIYTISGFESFEALVEIITQMLEDEKAEDKDAKSLYTIPVKVD